MNCSRGVAGPCCGSGEPERPIEPRTGRLNLRMLAVLALSTGCAQLPVETGPADFRFEGKVGVVEGERSHAARFIWRQTGERYDVVLWGPLGQGGTRLRGDPHLIEITGRNAEPALSGDPRQVMRQRLGWSLPLAVLPWWMSGRPAPDASVDAAEHDDEGRLTAFRQLGWQVSYDRFDTGEDPPAPVRITAERPGYRIRVTILSR